MDIEIQLTKGQLAYVSGEDEALAHLNWCCSSKAAEKTQYAVRRKNGKIALLHREVMEGILGRPLATREHVDHVDGDGLNNRRSNLRIATKSQNGANRAPIKSNTSGYVGVYFYKRDLKWRCQITIDRKTKCLGYFDNILDAVRTYDIACIKAFGEFSRPNYTAASYGLRDWSPLVVQKIPEISKTSVSTRLFVNSSSGFRGVTFHKADKKWYANIRVKNITYFLGSFAGIDDAITAYDLAAIRYHGTSTHTNRPLDFYLSQNVVDTAHPARKNAAIFRGVTKKGARWGPVS